MSGTRSGRWNGREVRRHRFLPVALALLVSLGLLFDGLNSMFGNALVGLAAPSLLAVFLITLPVPIRFWHRASPVLCVVVVSGAWAAAGFIGNGRFAWDGPPVAPDLGGSALIGYMGYCAALLCGAVVGAQRRPLSVTVDWLLLFGTIAIVAALAWGEDTAGLLWTTGDEARFFGTLGNANVAASVYGGFAALALARALSFGDQIWRTNQALVDRLHASALWLAFVVAVAACLLTASRMGTVLMGSALTIVATRAIWRGRWRARPLLMGAGLVAIAAAGLSTVLIERFDRLPDEVSIRLLLWRHNAEVAWARPVSGYGLGGFASVNARALGDVPTAQAIWMTNSPHDIALRLMIDAGLPYLALVALGSVLVAVAIVRAARLRPLNLTETALVAATGTIIGSAAVDIALEVPGVVALMLVYVGLLWGRAIARRGDIAVATAVREPGGREARISRRRTRRVEQGRASGR